jgi:Sulfotransferase family
MPAEPPQAGSPQVKSPSEGPAMEGPADRAVAAGSPAPGAPGGSPTRPEPVPGQPAARRGKPLISRPLIVIGAPRSGTTMIFQALSAHPDLWSLYRESQEVIGRFFHASMTPGSSGLVTADDVDDVMAMAIERAFFDAVGNVEGGPQWVSKSLPLILRTRLSGTIRKLGQQKKVSPIRIVEKQPGNSFRIQMLRKVFPDAQFVYVLRDPRGSIASIYKGWHEERFQNGGFELPAGYTIRGYDGKTWCFGLPPDWPEFDGASLIEICAHQWVSYNEYCLRDLPDDPAQVMRVRYEELSSKPGPVLQELARWADLDPVPLKRFEEKLPVVNTWTKPGEDKWRRYEDEISTVIDQVTPMSHRLGYDLAS